MQFLNKILVWYILEWFPNDYSKNPSKTQLSDIFKEFLPKFFSKKLQNAWLGNNLNQA